MAATIINIPCNVLPLEMISAPNTILAMPKIGGKSSNATPAKIHPSIINTFKLGIL